MDEIWKELVGFEGLYLVSNKGQIKSLPRQGSQGGIMVGTQHPKGYRYVTLRKDGKQYTMKVHRLVAQTFIPNPKDLPEVNHINEDKSDNRVENLEWCSTQYNHEYGTRTERARVSCGKPIRCIETGKEYQGAKWAANELALDPSSITKCLKNPNRTSGGYHWEYINKT